jgi:hypothetical protein
MGEKIKQAATNTKKNGKGTVLSEDSEPAPLARPLAKPLRFKKAKSDVGPVDRVINWPSRLMINKRQCNKQSF